MAGPMRPVRVLGKGDARRAELHAGRSFAQRLAGMTKEQRARRERLLQGQLHNARVNELAIRIMAWLEHSDKDEPNQETLAFLLEKVTGLLKTMTDWQAAGILEAAQRSYAVKKRQDALKAEAQPYSPEELAAFAALGEE